MLLTALVGCRMVDSDDGIDDGNKTDDPSDNTVVYTKELWGEWLRMDTGDTWYISDNTITVNGAEAATSATLTKQSDQVIEVTDGGRKYYLYASRTATASFTGVIAMDATGSIRAASRGSKVTAKNKNNKANEVSAVTDEDGKFTVEGVILGDPYQVIPEGGSPVTITPRSDGGDIGVITVTSGVNFKTALIPTQSSTDMTELYMNEAYQFDIEFENVGDEDCPAPSYTIIEPSGVAITGALQGILGTIEPGVKKSVPISVRCSAITDDHEYKKINIRIADGAGKTWEDSVSLRFYKETMGFNIKAEKPISGIIISPDTKTYSFTDVTNGTVVTPRRTAGNYLVVFSGATIETETRYSLGIGTEAEGDFSAFTETGRYEPNNAEAEAVSLSEQKLMAYLYKNDIDYYRVFYGNFRLPPAPINVTASAADAQVTVSWTAVTGASSYNVYRSDSQTGTYTKVGASTTTSYVDTVGGVGTYYYKASAVNASDFESAPSTPTTVTVTPPAVPTNVSASAADAQVTVSWTAVTGAGSYNIYRSDSQTGMYTKIGASTTASYIDTVTATGTYYYKASTVSMGDFESAPSTPITVAVTPPAAPTNVSASAVDNQVTVSWNAVTGAKSYNVYRSDSQTGTYTKVGASTTTPYDDTVTATGTYYYKASAVSAGGFESAHSTPITVAVAGPPSPTDVSASAADAQVTVSWTAVDGAKSYNVYRSDSQTGTYTKVGTPTTASYVDTVTATGTYYYKVSAVSASDFESALSTPITVAVAGPPAPTNVSTIAADAQVTVSWTAVTEAKSYNVYRSDSQTGTYTKVGTPTTASYIDTVTATGTYYYKASAVSASDFESALSTPTAVAVAGPAVPTNVTASAADAQVSVSWTAVTEAKSYNIYRSTSQTGTYTKVGAPTTTSYVDTVTVTGTYYYKASAVSMGGLESDHSMPTTVAVAGPSTPTNVTASAANTQVTVSWTAVTGAKSYNVYRSTNQTGTYTKVGAPTTTSYVDTVTVTGTYYYKVSAVSEGGLESAYSASTTVTIAMIEIDVTNLSETLSWLSANVVSSGHYTLLLGKNETISARTLSYSGVNITITLKGKGGEQTVSLSGNGPLFTIASGATLVLDSGVTLKGHSSNNTSLVQVNSGGNLVLKDGGAISGNTGGGVYVRDSGTFTMNGGDISGNTAWDGGGVYVSSNGTFTMSGGKISGNSASASSANGGGGVSVYDSGTFTMSGGTISGNTAKYGGGVEVSSNSTFTMSGGTISGNTASHAGGGVALWSTFTMSGGTISGNSAEYGGGVYANGTFTKQAGGIIYGSNATSALKNTATSGGHAVYVDSSPTPAPAKRNTTAGTGVTLDSSKSGSAGGWE
jgi:fibronectin type 3 domain-containing protein